MVVGTAFIVPGEFEPSAGRVLVFRVEGEGDHRKVGLVAEKHVSGAVYAVNSLRDMVLVGCNNELQLFDWHQDDQSLDHVCSHSGHIAALYVRTQGDFVLVGDIMRSMSLIRYDNEDRTLQPCARDLNANWMTAVEMLDENTFLGAENDCNLFTVYRNLDATSEEERARLELGGECHVGEFINSFVRGTLVMQQADSDSASAVIAGQPVLFGSVSGAIGSIMPLTLETFDFLQRVQRAMTKVVSSIGNMNHTEWRSFYSIRRIAAARNFLDGDLIESFLDLPQEDRDKVVELIKNDAASEPGAMASGSPAEKLRSLQASEVFNRVEEISRLH